jgi:hypothetical protein
MAGVYRATRVGSSTCPKPSQSTDGATLGLVDYSDHSVSAADKFMAGCVERGDYSPDLISYFE